tara:strand:+ start:94 stop:402 length:309 start_codon:yes stop_codon:yes gene_type:complete
MREYKINFKYRDVYGDKQNDAVNLRLRDEQRNDESFIVDVLSRLNVCSAVQISIHSIKEVLDIDKTHDRLREILQEYGNEEFGDCIIDDISELFGYKTTINK